MKMDSVIQCEIRSKNITEQLAKISTDGLLQINYQASSKRIF